MGLSGIKPINILSDPSFYLKIMQKYQAGKKNTSRFPSMFFYKGKGSVFPQKINMTLKFSFHLNQQNIVPLLILKNIHDNERTLSRLNTEKKALKSVLELKNAQKTDSVTKILLSVLGAFKATQGCSAISKYILTGNFSTNKTSVFSSLKSLIFTAESIISNLSKVTKISFLPPFNASSQQKTLTISPELLTLNSRIFPLNSKVLNCEKKTETLNSCFFASKSSYMRLGASRKPIFIYNENTLNCLPVLEGKLLSNYLQKQTLTPSLVLKNTNVIKKILSRLDIEKNSLQSPVKQENTLSRNNVANISQAVFEILRRFKVLSEISSVFPSNEYIFTGNTPIFSSLKLLSSMSGNRVNYPINKLKLSFISVSNTFSPRNILATFPGILTPSSKTFLFNSKALNYESSTDILNLQISGTKISYISFLKHLYPKSENILKYLTNLMKLSFLPVNNTFYQRNFLTVFPDVLTQSSRNFRLSSKVLNYENRIDILNLQISRTETGRTETGYTLLNPVKKFTFTDNESTFNYLPVHKEAVCRFFCKITNLKKLQGRKFPIGRTKLHTVHKKLTSNLQKTRDIAHKDKFSSSYLRKQALKYSFIEKKVNIVEEMVSRSGPDRNYLQVLSKPINVRNKTDIANIIQALFRVSQGISVASEHLLPGNASNNQIAAFSHLRSLISRYVNLTNILNKIIPSFLSVNNAFYSQKNSTVLSDILALSPKISCGNELFISSEKKRILTVLTKYAERFFDFRFSTTHTDGTKLLNYENNLETLNSYRIRENTYSKLLNFAKSLTFIRKENKPGYRSVFENKFSSSYSEKQNISSILTLKKFPFIKEIFPCLTTKKISLQKLVKSVDAQKKNEAVNISQAVFKIPGIDPIGSGTLSTGHIFTNQTSIFPFPGPAYELLINYEKANMFTVFKKYIRRFLNFRFLATHTHNLSLKSLTFKSGNKVINLNRILNLPYLPENSIHYKVATLSIYSEAADFSFPTFNYNNRKTLNSQVFKVNKSYVSLNVAKDTDFININSKVKNQLISGNKLNSALINNNLSLNKIRGINKRFFKVSNRITVNKPFVKNSYVHFEHETPDYILSKYNYEIRDESLVFQDQEHIKQEIEKIKKTLIETKQSISEKKIPVFGEADIKKYIDINRISSQVYQNLERTIRMERERRGM